MKLLFTALFLVLLTACNSTPNGSTPPAGTNKSQRLDYSFYYSLAAAFNEGDRSAYLGLINETSIKEYVLLQRNEQPLVNVYGSHWYKVYTKALAELAAVESLTQWQYLYSEQAQGLCCDIAYFRYYVGEAFQYVAMSFNKSRHIVDLDFITTAFSTVELLNESVAFSSMLKNQYEPEAMEKFTAYMKAAQSGNVEGFLQAFERLPEEVQLTPFISDLTFRRLSMYSTEDQARFNAVWKSKLEQKDIVLPTLLGAYVESKQYELAIRAVKQLPEFALQDFYFQAELGALYAELGQADKAIEHGRNAILYAPDIFISYWMFAALAISTQEYELAIQTFKVMETKFSVEITRELLQELDEDGKFLASAVYLNWYQQQSSSS